MADALPLQPLTGNLWCPVWAIRPGAYEALAGLEDCMPLWLLLHSRNADAWKPCYASRESLGMTIGMGTRTVSRRLARLRDAALVWELDHGIDPRTRRHRPPARWALDPMAYHYWRPKVEEQLAELAERHSHGTRWYRRAVQALNTLEKRSRRLRTELAASMPITPRPPRASKRPRAKKSRGPRGNTPPNRLPPIELDGAAGQFVPGQNGPPGDVFTTEGGREERRRRTRGGDT